MVRGRVRAYGGNLGGKGRTLAREVALTRVLGTGSRT